MYGFRLRGWKAGSESGDVQSAGASPDTLRVPGLEAVASWNKKDKAAGKSELSLQPYPFYSARLIVGKSEECPDTIGAGAIMKKFIYVC